MGVDLGVNFYTQTMNIKRNITFCLENPKKDGKPIAENVPIRMRVVYSGHRIEFTTGYRIDLAKWNENYNG